MLPAEIQRVAEERKFSNQVILKFFNIPRNPCSAAVEWGFSTLAHLLYAITIRTKNVAQC